MHLARNLNGCGNLSWIGKRKRIHCSLYRSEGRGRDAMAKLTAKRRTTHPLWPPPKSLEPGLWPILAEALGLQFLPKSANQKKKEYMAILKAARRNKLAKSTFGLPGSRKYPMPDKSH